MNQVQVHEMANSLYQEHGSKAMRVAAEKALECERREDRTNAETWRRVEQAIAGLRGAPEG